MTAGLCFWVLMLLWLILGLYRAWPRDSAGYIPFGGNLLLFILLLILGWSSFGPPLRF